MGNLIVGELPMCSSGNEMKNKRNRGSGQSAKVPLVLSHFTAEFGMDALGTSPKAMNEFASHIRS